MSNATVPPTLPADPNTAETLPPVSGTTADLMLALNGMHVPALRAPRMPTQVA